MASDITPHLELPLLAAAQAQKHVTHNEALIRLDAIVQLSVLTRTLASPPESPADGDRHVVAAAATGTWAGRSGYVAVRIDGGWDFVEPHPGWIAWVEAEAKLIVYAGDTSGWTDFSGVFAAGVPRLGVNTGADAVNRLAVKADAALLSHDDVTPGSGDMRVTVNKAAAGRDAGFVFQDNWSSRALFGLLGSDDFALKVSPDGASFITALSVSRATGRVSLGQDLTIENGGTGASTPAKARWNLGFRANVVKRNKVTSSAWLASASAADNTWSSLCWAAELGLFVAIATSGAGNRVMTSPDGVNWTARASAADNQWTSICWSPELRLFVAVARSGTGNRVMTSPDGIAWTARASAADNVWQSICWASELRLFVAVADGAPAASSVMTSPDGITWTARTASVLDGWQSICWAPEIGLLIALGYAGSIMTSPDGVSWSLRFNSAPHVGWGSVCWSPELGLAAAVANTGTGNRVMTSPDGVGWTVRASAADNAWQSVCWASEIGLFIAVSWSGTGNRVMTSPDGITWTTRTSAADNGWGGVCWSPELGLAVAIGSSGSGNRVMTSVSAHAITYRS
jgi:hypothetical protein